MDHGFNDRVDKVFGSISSSSSSTPWSLTDAQIERRVWNRDKGNTRDDDETLVSSSFESLFHSQTKSVDDDDDDDDGVQIENDWDIRSTIGLDPTLDNEEEEDAYDKMAEGRENDSDRLYMKDVTDHGPYLNSHNILPTSVRNVKKDPRANHDAAKTRLKEDDGLKIKSILKRKCDEVVKPGKRVRFDPACKNDDKLTNVAEPQGTEKRGNVPDYIINPSKYTKYDFNDFSGDVNNDDNNNNNDEKECGELSGALPQSVVFIPRKKRGDACNSEEQVKQPCTSVGVVIGDVQEDEISEMQEEEELSACSKSRFQKTGRQYRSKMDEDDNVC